jgi:3',5'-cyclic AMP phosphodiesterase CpdA
MTSGHEPPPTVRLAHFSDIHVTARAVWRPGDWVNKRLTAWLNLRFLGRGRRFRDADAVLAALRADWQQRRPDHLVLSGDATALGFPEEVAHAAALLPVGEWPGLAVPGNHDYCTAAARRSGAFERCFAPWQHGERLAGHTYPFAQKVGHVWLVAVNSATVNRWALDARGAVGRDQLDRLEVLLGRLGGGGGDSPPIPTTAGPRVLVTHYPIAIPSGKPEHHFRVLRDVDDLVAVAVRGGIGLWLHGHRHDAYHLLPGEAAPFPVICAGSATQTHRWSYDEHTITGRHLLARRRVFDAARGAFRDGATFELELVCPVPLEQGSRVGTGERR